VTVVCLAVGGLLQESNRPHRNLDLVYTTNVPMSPSPNRGKVSGKVLCGACRFCHLRIPQERRPSRETHSPPPTTRSRRHDRTAQQQQQQQGADKETRRRKLDTHPTYRALTVSLFIFNNCRPSGEWGPQNATTATRSTSFWQLLPMCVHARI
jgi:hypothetical protein